MRFVIIDGDEVTNVALAYTPQGNNWMAHELAGIGWRFVDGALLPPPSADTPAPRHISRGAFFDRFGPLKWAILADERPAVRAVITDASVRTYIDLDDPQLPAGLAILQSAGHEIDPAAIMGAPVRAQERP
ncbi:MAG TPA: hypothetical protein VMS38_07580 [Pseudorhodoferax sp.]|nr:hypothetical protein [Pseudorhodoferax sp.]